MKALKNGINGSVAMASIQLLKGLMKVQVHRMVILGLIVSPTAGLADSKKQVSKKSQLVSKRDFKKTDSKSKVENKNFKFVFKNPVLAKNLIKKMSYQERVKIQLASIRILAAEESRLSKAKRYADANSILFDLFDVAHADAGDSLKCPYAGHMIPMENGKCNMIGYMNSNPNAGLGCSTGSGSPGVKCNSSYFVLPGNAEICVPMYLELQKVARGMSTTQACTIAYQVMLGQAVEGKDLVAPVDYKVPQGTGNLESLIANEKVKAQISDKLNASFAKDLSPFGEVATICSNLGNDDIGQKQLPDCSLVQGTLATALEKAMGKTKDQLDAEVKRVAPAQAATPAGAASGGATATAVASAAASATSDTGRSAGIPAATAQAPGGAVPFDFALLGGRATDIDRFCSWITDPIARTNLGCGQATSSGQSLEVQAPAEKECFIFDQLEGEHQCQGKNSDGYESLGGTKEQKFMVMRASKINGKYVSKIYFSESPSGKYCESSAKLVSDSDSFGEKSFEDNDSGFSNLTNPKGFEVCGGNSAHFEVNGKKLKITKANGLRNNCEIAVGKENSVLQSSFIPGFDWISGVAYDDSIDIPKINEKLNAETSKNFCLDASKVSAWEAQVALSEYSSCAIAKIQVGRPYVELEGGTQRVVGSFGEVISSGSKYDWQISQTAADVDLPSEFNNTENRFEWSRSEYKGRSGRTTMEWLFGDVREWSPGDSIANGPYYKSPSSLSSALSYKDGKGVDQRVCGPTTLAKNVASGEARNKGDAKVEGAE